MASKNPKVNKKSGSGVDAGTQRSLAVVQDAATRDSNQSMKQAIEITLKIFQNAQFVKDHRTSSQKVGDNIVVLIAKIWKAYLELPADEKQNWPPKNDIEELVLELEPFLAFVEEQQVKRKKTAERVWNSLTDSDSGREYRDRVHGAIRLFEEKHPQINDASHRVRVEDEKERTPDADLRQLTEEKKVHIIEELHRLQAEGVTDEEARQPQRSSRISYKEAKERLQDPESDHQHKEEQTEIERLREVIRVMKEDKKAAEEMEERKREEKEMDRKERARQREDRARVEAEEQRRRERIRIAEEDEKQRVFDRRTALEQIEKEAKATRITRMESIMSEQDESGEESSSDATEEPARKLGPPMFLPPLYPGQYPVDVFRWYSPSVEPTNGSPPTTNHISGFNKATIDGGVNIGNVTNSDNTKSGNSVPCQKYASEPRQGRRVKSRK